MATVLTLPRSMPVVLADIATSQARLSLLDARIGHGDPTPAEDVLWSELEARIDAAKAEANAMIQSATGVSWDELYKVLA